MEFDLKLLNVLAGVIFGFAPFLAGMLKNRLDFAFAGLMACTISSRIGGIVAAVLVSLISVILIWYYKPKTNVP
jgi:hypothetical protein